ncbi:hypothetical protein [Meridianimaribacter flavus]|uniref:LPXTG cell wall anchor domain-containing protein n=1 Tax=Meridianimaribacter flavus TaxID=571115 RepID=A0ABY2G845_9FLAO|nr:hypothetical protein [Meridianimaribacter flavus]TDY13954.1 hypothetical protein A8975_0553 [Meridianimaribacter flavus]
MKILSFFQYVYAFVAIVFTYEAINEWNVDRNRSYFMLFLAALATFMFFFRKRFRKKFEDRNQK